MRSTHRRPATSPEAALSTAAIRAWLDNHAACVAAGVNVGTIREAKARRLSTILRVRENVAAVRH